MNRLIKTFMLGVSFLCLCGCSNSYPVIERHTQFDPGIEKEMNDFLLENKEYAAKKIEEKTFRKKMEAIEDRLIADSPELKKELDEVRKKIPGKYFWYPEFTTKLEPVFLKDKEYSTAYLQLHVFSAEVYLLSAKIRMYSNDPRVVRYNDEMDKLTTPYIMRTSSLQKSKVEGSDEFKAAMCLMELYRKDPVKHNREMTDGYSLLYARLLRFAKKTDPNIVVLERKIQLAGLETLLQNARFNLKNSDLYWRCFEGERSIVSKNQEGTLKYQKFSPEYYLQRGSDSAYVEASKVSQKAFTDFRKAVDEFAAKSSAPEAVEYRKFKALMDEMNKKPDR